MVVFMNVSFPIITATAFIQIVCSCEGLLKITTQLNLSEAYLEPADPKPKTALVAGTVGDLVLESPVALGWRAGGMIHTARSLVTSRKLTLCQTQHQPAGPALVGFPLSADDLKTLLRRIRS